MEVYINKVLTMKLICTPDELDALVVGRLYTEGIIASTGEIISLHICKYGNRADVIIDEEPAHDGSFVDTTPSCCTGNKLLNDLFRSNSLSPVSPIEYKDEWVYSLAEEFADATPLFLKTHSVHSAFLAQNGKTLYMSEDLGRHNALDKVIGKALIDGIDLKTSLLFTSGRVPTDMAEKAIRGNSRSDLKNSCHGCRHRACPGIQSDTSFEGSSRKLFNGVVSRFYNDEQSPLKRYKCLLLSYLIAYPTGSHG